MPQPLAMLPDAWAVQGRCPVCGAAPLTIERQLEADRLACARCGVAFEVEAGGPRIRWVRPPAGVAATPDNAWRTAAEARAWVREHVRPASAAAPASAPLSPAPVAAPSKPIPSVPVVSAPPLALGLDVDEALVQARALLALRHTPAQIRAILEKSGQWTAEPVQAALAEVTRLDDQQRTRQSRALWLTVGGAVSALLIVFVAAGLVLARPWAAPLDTFRATPADAPAPNPASDLPAPLQTLIPPGVRVLNATPVVRIGPDSGAPEVSACPRSPAEAAALFGGEADLWQSDDSGGWMLFSTSAVTVRVPAGMTAGYLTFGQDLRLTDVSGPAALENVYMLAVACR